MEELCNTEQKPVWKIVLKAEQTETDETEKQIFERMRQMYHEMKAADEGYAAELRSASGMAGGDGEKMHRFNVTGKNLCSGYMALAMEKALKMGITDNKEGLNSSSNKLVANFEIIINCSFPAFSVGTIKANTYFTFVSSIVSQSNGFLHFTKNTAVSFAYSDFA